MTDAPRDPAEGHDESPPVVTEPPAVAPDVAPDDAPDDGDPGDAGTVDPDASHDAAEADDDGALVVVDAELDPRTRQELLTELVEAESRRDEYLEDVRRARAELDNFRKRTMREGAQQREQGRIDIAGALLEVLDDLDRTVQAADGSSDDALATGVRLVADKLTTQLGTVGLQRIDAIDVPFDPNEHEAVQQQPADAPVDHPVVASVLRPGYRLGQRVIRAAMVVVAQ